MIKVLLRLKGLTTDQHRDLLLSTEEGGELYPDIHYKGSPRKKGEVVVDLSINEFIGDEPWENAPGTHHRTTRESIGKLWRMLGIFPRDRKKLSEVRAALLDISSAAIALREFQRPPNQTDLPNYRPADEITTGILESIKKIEALIDLEVTT